jgi:hypothetical protein
MNYNQYVNKAEARKVSSKSYGSGRKMEIRNKICNYYRQEFLDMISDFDTVERKDALNRSILSDIANEYRQELNNYYDTYYSNKDVVQTVRGILIQAGIYVATAYTKCKDTFHLVNFAGDYLPDAVFQVWRKIDTDKRRFKALRDYAEYSYDSNTVDFLNDVKMNCRIV